MEHLQTPWNESSAQIAEAKTEHDSHQAELERLQQAQLELRQDISELEVTIGEAQKARASRLRSGLREAASAFSDRSRFYAAMQSGDVFDPKKIQEEKEAITFYEMAKTELMKERLKSDYEQALRNQEERQKAKSFETIEAGVVLHKKGEHKLDIYFTALTNSTGSLAKNLAGAVLTAIQDSAVFAVESNVEDILRVTVEGDYQTLIQNLKGLEPVGFKEAQVEYQAIILGGEKTKRKTSQRRKSSEVIKVDKIPEGYIHVEEAAEKAGIHKSSFYKHRDHGRIQISLYELPNRKPNAYVFTTDLEKLCKSLSKSLPEAKNDDSMQAISPLSAEPLSEQVATDNEAVVGQEAGIHLDSLLGERASNYATTTIDTEADLVTASQPESLARRILGDEKHFDLIVRYEVPMIEAVVRDVTSCLGEERAKTLLAADVKELLFKEKEQNRGMYLGRLNVLLSEIDNKYGAEVPSEYSFEAKPSNFFPANLSAMERKIEQAVAKPKPSTPSAELLDKIYIKPEMAERLQEQGFNPIYVYAMIKEGFGIGSSKQYIGEAYFPREYWRDRTRRALNSIGIRSMNEAEFSLHEKKFRQLKLINEKTKQEHPLAFSPKWSDTTSGAIKEYIASFFPKK